MTGSRRVIVLGPDHERPAGGIAVALSGFLEALDREELLYTKLTTHDTHRPGGRWRPALEAVRALVAAVRAVRANGERPVVYAHAGGPASISRKTALLRIARSAGALTMVQLHSPLVDRVIATAAGRAFLKAALSQADRVCVLTPYWAARLRWAGVRRPVAVVPDPLPPVAERAARAGWHPPPAGPGVRVLAMTRLAAGKGVEVAVQAMAHCPSSFALTVAGDGPERASLEALALSSGVAGRVTFAGWVSGDAKQDLLVSNDVFCLPSVRDSFGMGFVEAMAVGRPVVAARYGAVPDVVPDGRAGWLVPPADPLATAAALVRLSDPAERERLGRAGQRWVLERFAIEQVGRRLRQVMP